MTSFSTEAGSSCTNETSYAVGPWLGTGPEFTIVDTPGFQDTDSVSNKSLAVVVVQWSTSLHSTTMIRVQTHCTLMLRKDKKMNEIGAANGLFLKNNKPLKTSNEQRTFIEI